MSINNKPRKNISKEEEDKPKEWNERLKIDWIYYGEGIKGISKSGGGLFFPSVTESFQRAKEKKRGGFGNLIKETQA